MNARPWKVHDQEGLINDHCITRYQERHKGACKTMNLCLTS